MHPNEGTLRALLDGEVAPAEEAALSRHLEGCAVCSREMESLREEWSRVLGALRVLDAPAPVRQAHREFTRRRTRTAWAPALRRAAVLLLFAGTAVSATVPGSPLREWLEERWGAAPAAEEARSAPPAAPGGAAAPVAAASGISVRPAEGRMRVVLVQPAPGLRLRVRLSAGSHVRVTAAEGVGARFRTRPDRIEVVDGGPGELRVEVPRSVRHFALEVDGRVFLSKEGEELRFPEGPAESTGPEMVFEVRP